jgi:DNA repair protein RadD
MQDILSEKNLRLLELEVARRTGTSRREVEQLASRVAVLETTLATRHFNDARIEDGVINLVSAASALMMAHRPNEAARVFINARTATRRVQTAAWIDAQIARLDIDRIPAQAFANAAAHIKDNIRLRIPQREAYIAAQHHFNNSRDHAIIQLPVGCGKTGTMAILPFGLARGRALVLAPNLEITNTIVRSIDHTAPQSFFRRTGVLVNGVGPTSAVLDSEANILDADNSDFVVTNIQQLVAGSSAKWLDRLSPDYFDLILVDEGHHNVAPSWQQVFERFPQAKVASFTATPFRSDGRELQGRRIYRFPIADAIRNGYVRDLSTRKLEPSRLTFEYRGSKRELTLNEILEMREQDWFSKGVALARESNEHIVDASIQCVHELRETGQMHHQIIASACSIDHAKSIRSLYEERNCAAAVIHSRLKSEEQDRIRKHLAEGILDVVVHVQMFGEGADYPNLGVAAIFRPYRHLVPYVQFVGRIMRVVKQDSPGDPNNRGYVVSHVGLNIDRWWDELRLLDQDDQLFFEQMANAELEFLNPIDTDETSKRRLFKAPMQVLDEVLERFVEVAFLEADARALVDDVISALEMRGVGFDTLGLSREELEQRLLTQVRREKVGKVSQKTVQPQRRRQQARARLDERVRSGAKELLNELKLKNGGFQLPKLFPEYGATNNLGAAIILLNRQVQAFLGTGSKERDLLSEEELNRAYESMDDLVDSVAALVRKTKGN